ncbi:MAG: site-specific DNA-methyltransferase [Lachnospiraceae bacterium]
MEYKKVNQNINNIVNDQVRKLESIFPSAVKDGEVDFEALREELGLFEEVDSEKYELTWSGKKDAKKIAQEDVYGRTLKFIPEDSKDADTTENLYIEGDNLEVLKLLRQNYYGAIKMIYIDPPYNTGNDFIYNDSFTNSITEYDDQSGNVDEFGQKYEKNTITNGRFHSSWCSMIYMRLKIARDLLTDDGIMFVSIDDNEMDNLRKIGDEIFGDGNFIAHIIHKNNSMKNQSKYIGVSTEYVLIYAKNLQYMNSLGKVWRANKKGVDEVVNVFNRLKANGESIDAIRDEIMEMYSRPKYAHLSRWNKVDEFGVFTDKDLSRNNGPKNYSIINPNTGKPCPIPNRGWAKSYQELLNLQEENMIWYGDANTPPRQKSYITDGDGSVFDNFVFADTSIEKRNLEKMFGATVFEFPKSVEMIMSFIRLCTDKNDIVLDFFSGSASTAHAVMELNLKDNGKRKYVMVQLPEICDEKSEAYKAGYKNICEIGKERIRRAGDKIKSENPDADIDIGFKVFKTADTNIKWNSNIDAGQLDVAQMEYTPDLVDFMQNANDVDIVYELMLRQRDIPLSEPLEQLSDIGSRTYLYANSYLVCLETEITEDLVFKLAELDPLPIKFIFRDSAFKDDISLKDETFRRLKALIEKSAGTNKPAYTVEFI